MRLRPISAYASEIKPFLPAGSFAPAYSRLLWLAVHVAIVGCAIWALTQGFLAWWLSLFLSPVIGMSFAGLTFLGHEALHGAIVRSPRVRRLIGRLCFLPFAISPTLWVGWHNRVHHGRTNRPAGDPDAYPTLPVYKGSRAVRMITDYVAPGRRQLYALGLSLCFGFTGQSTHMLFRARRLGILSRNEQLRAICDTALAVAFWAAVALVVGPVPFLLGFLAPLFVANAIVMSFIFTNHSLSSLTDVNDPLANSLSVTLPRWLEWLTLSFGFHVEHHLFPAMSARHARKVREVLVTRWPERYNSLPLGRALVLLYRSPRVYKTHNVLVDPRSGSEWPIKQPAVPREGTAA
jgi:fatty acid desaturase